MLAAIIDCGTNTFNLLIVDYQPEGTHKILQNLKKSVKLGEGGLKDNRIAPAAYKRGLDAFHALVEIALDSNVDQIQAYATSAIRSSMNGPDFVKQIMEETGVLIQVINGDTEAQLIYKGVMLAMNNPTESMLIMDIGGGSTEFIIARNNGVVWKKSFDLGVARLLQQIQFSDPILPHEKEALKAYLEDMLQPLTQQIRKNPVDMLIGCSGSFESLAEMIAAEKKVEALPNGAHFFTFEAEDLKNMHRLLLDSNEAKRKKMPGLVEYRVDTIVYASIFIRLVKKLYNIKKINYSSYALKEGVLSDMIKSSRERLAL